MEKYNFTLTSESVMITSLPFFRKLTHLDGKIGKNPALYLLNCTNGLTNLLDEIYAESGNKIVLDCALFAQLMIHYETNPTTNTCLFVIGAPVNALSLYDGSLRLCYLRPTDNDAFKYLQQSSCIAKGQYLVKTDTDNIYIGLGSKGITAQSLEEWTAELIDGCIKWSEEEDSHYLCSNGSHYRRMDLGIQESLKGIISIYLKTNRLSSWHIEKDFLFE